MSEGALHQFPGELAPTARVGGKGASLMRMAEAGLPVPPGVVLAVEFFAPWFQQLRASAAWAELVARGPEAWTQTFRAGVRDEELVTEDPDSLFSNFASDTLVTSYATQADVSLGSGRTLIVGAEREEREAESVGKDLIRR